MASVLITGTSRGIGFETALAFARAGHTVHATMRNPAASPQLSEVAAREKLPIHISTMDVDSDSSVTSAIAAIRSSHGSIDVLVNNAGIERAGSVEELPLADFRACMETNYFGMLRCMQALIPSMRQRRSGCIISVTSIAGRLASPPLTPYMASKWAAEALCEGLAGELKAFNIRVAIVEPGIIDTAMARRLSEDETHSAYPHTARFSQMFQNSLQNPTPPSLVADKILEIAESGTWQLRHPVGPDAAPFLDWRSSMSDEDWINLNAGDDATFFARLQQAFAPNAQPAD
ncbi:MAG TPA: SDR family oxidoreductase [Terracidiphilus sp.]|nr:SDR family oxidoreductase [Terracidiphilus sp.]